MQPPEMLDKVEKGIHALVKALSWVAVIALSGMILFVVGNILTRFFLRKPIPGTIELVELIAVVVVFLAIGYTELRRGHISIEMLTVRLSPRTRSVLASTMYFLSAVFAFVMGWRGAVLAWSYIFPTFRESYVLSIPFSPFIFVIAFGSLLLGLEHLIHVFRPLPADEETGEVV